MTTVLSAPDTSKLHGLSDLTPEVALREAASFLAHLIGDPAFLDTYIVPLLEDAIAAEDWYVAHRYDSQDGSYSLQVFVWPLATKTQIGVVIVPRVVGGKDR